MIRIPERLGSDNCAVNSPRKCPDRLRTVGQVLEEECRALAKAQTHKQILIERTSFHPPGH